MEIKLCKKDIFWNRIFYDFIACYFSLPVGIHFKDVQEFFGEENFLHTLFMYFSCYNFMKRVITKVNKVIISFVALITWNIALLIWN